MVMRLVVGGLCLALCGSAQATPVRVSAEAPLSGERFGDALRSYLDGAEVTVEAAPAQVDVGGSVAGPEVGSVRVTLRKSRGAGEDGEIVLMDGEETILVRLPGALRSEDLYRAAALKVQALLQRQATPVVAQPPQGLAAEGSPPAEHWRDRLALEVGLAWMLPSAGPSREGLRLGTGMRLGNRWRVRLGAYLESPQSTTSQGIAVSAWELPFDVTLGLAWHQGAWQGWLHAVGQAAIRRISAEAAGIVSASDTTLSPRAGGALAFGMALAPGLYADARVSLLAALADTRYRVDGQVVWPAAAALMLVEIGISHGGR
jgi:hypothetical protein